MESEHNRVRGVLIDTISLLCKSSLTYTDQLKIEGVIGITVDGCIFLVHVDQQFGPGDAEETSQPQFDFGNPGVQVKTEKNNAHDDSYQLPKKPAPGGRGRGTRAQNVYVKAEPGTIKQEPQNAFQAPTPRKRQRQQRAAPRADSNPVPFLDEYPEEVEERGYDVGFEEAPASYSPSYEMQDEGSGDWSYGPPRKPAKTRAGGSHRGTRGSGAGRRNSATVHRDGTSLVITESSHICGYPGCFKRFKFRHDLLRHQTKKHGRKPAFTRARAPNNAPTSNEEDYYYEGEEEEGFDAPAENEGDVGYDYAYQ